MLSLNKKDIVLLIIALVILFFNWRAFLLIGAFFIIIYLWQLSLQWAILERYKTMAWKKNKQNERNK